MAISLIMGVAAPLSEIWFVKDYWRPETVTGWPVSIEDFLFGFLVGGIASVIYEELFGRRHANRKNRKHHWSWFIVPTLALFLISFGTLFSILKLTSMYAAVTGYLLVAGVIIYWRHDLWRDSVISGLIAGVAMFLGYMIFLSFYPDAIHRWWLLNNISGISLYGVPIEELIWAFGWGMVIGPIYEFFAGLSYQKARR